MNNIQMKRALRRRARNNILPLDHPPFKINQATIDYVRGLTQNGTKKFHKAYAFLADYLADKTDAPKELIFWFRKAAEINSNDPDSTANASIRAGNKKAAELDKRPMNPAFQQELSNRIGRNVLDKVLKGQIPNLHTITQKDALSTIKELSRTSKDKKNQKVDLSNWVGAAWSWNIPVTINGVTQTIGAHISGDPKKLEKFIEVQVAAALGADEKLNIPGEYAEILKLRFDPMMGPPEEIRNRITERVHYLRNNKLMGKAFNYLDGEEFEQETDTRKVIGEQNKTKFQQKNISVSLADNFFDKKTQTGQSPLKQAGITDHIKNVETPARTSKTFDAFEKYAEVMGTKDQPGEVKPSAVVATKIDGKTAPLALADKALPPKGPERVDLDPSYNPFNRDKNGFEDLEGEVHIWKKDPEKKDQLIREAGREKDFGLDIDYDSAGTPLPNKGPERVKRDPGYNPFDLALNGEEDLEGEAFIWKTDPQKKNRLIRQAGRESFFGLEDISFL